MKAAPWDDPQAASLVVGASIPAFGARVQYDLVMYAAKMHISGPSFLWTRGFQSCSMIKSTNCLSCLSVLSKLGMYTKPRDNIRLMYPYHTTGREDGTSWRPHLPIFPLKP